VISGSAIVVAESGRLWQGLVRTNGKLLAAVAVPVVAGQQVAGVLVLETPLSGATETAWSVTSLVFWGELVAVLLAAIVAYSFSRRLSWPLVYLRRSVADLGPDRWQDPIHLDGPLEVEELAGEFNQMQGRIHQQMVSLEQEKAKRDALLGHVTHDLRTPLTSIRGFLEAIRDGVVEGAGQARAVDVALEETLRLQRLVNRLLEATRIQSGTAPKYPVSVNAWIADTVERLGPVARSKAVKLEWTAPAESPTVQGVRDHLVEALMNVIDNAIKWAPAGTAVEVKERIEPGQVVVSVRDHGPGIRPEILPRVLDRFVTGDASRTDSSGLGLSIVADVMEEHGGDIVVENHSDGGAAVSLYLPLPTEPVTESDQ
jgi:signal transduction histidine kinase